jgi:mono/diheme cytochrome c family protein
MKLLLKAFLWAAIAALVSAVGIAIGDEPRCRHRNIAPELRDGRTYRHRDVVRIIDVVRIDPAYVSAYGPENYDASTQQDILAQIRTLSARLDQLTAVAAAAKTGTPAVVTPSVPGAPPVVVVPPTRPPGGGKAAGLAIFNAKCASCHQQGKLLDTQKFTLLTTKGDLASLTDKQKLNVLQKTFHGEMPPPQNSAGILPLTDPEFGTIADLLR